MIGRDWLGFLVKVDLSALFLRAFTKIGILLRLSVWSDCMILSFFFSFRLHGPVKISLCRREDRSNWVRLRSCMEHAYRFLKNRRFNWWVLLVGMQLSDLPEIFRIFFQLRSKLLNRLARMLVTTSLAREYSLSAHYSGANRIHGNVSILLLQ